MDLNRYFKSHPEISNLFGPNIKPNIKYTKFIITEAWNFHYFEHLVLKKPVNNSRVASVTTSWNQLSTVCRFWVHYRTIQFGTRPHRTAKTRQWYSVLPRAFVRGGGSTGVLASQWLHH